MGSNAWSKNNVIEDFEVRAMTTEDIPQVCQIEKDSFTLPWSESAFRSELEDNEMAFYHVVVPTSNPKQVVGYGGFWIIFDEAHITNIAIKSDLRGHRLGHLLVETMQQIARLKGAERMTLEVRVSNTNALKLYHRLNFKEEGVRKRYYSDNNEDALIMWCELKTEEKN